MYSYVCSSYVSCNICQCALCLLLRISNQLAHFPSIPLERRAFLASIAFCLKFCFCLVVAADVVAAAVVGIGSRDPRLGVASWETPTEVVMKVGTRFDDGDDDARLGVDLARALEGVVASAVDFRPAVLFAQSEPNSAVGVLDVVFSTFTATPVEGVTFFGICCRFDLSSLIDMLPLVVVLAVATVLIGEADEVVDTNGLMVTIGVGFGR